MKKVIILSFFVFLFTGCSATYDLEIYNNSIREDMKYVESDSSKWDSEVQYGFSYRKLVNASVAYPYPAFYNTVVDEDDTIKLKGIEYYKNRLIDNSLEFGQKLSYRKFKVDNFSDSSIVRDCYKYFNVSSDKDNIYISTSIENLCFDKYPLLDNITVNLKTNHKVLSSNANSVKGYHYTWNISREEKDDAAIQITLYKNKFVFNYENEFVKKIFYILLIVGIISIGGSVVYKHYKNKNKKLNEV